MRGISRFWRDEQPFVPGKKEGKGIRKMKQLACALALLSGVSALAADVTVDFAKPTGTVNPLLHSSGCAPRLYPRAIRHDDADIRAMGFAATRTHDWALWNNGQRIIDTHFIFPLMHLDAKDPKNYFFKATDEVLKLSRDLGLKIFYRLGPSIEHTEGVHFNVLDPEDHEKYAEVLAGIMRHYLKGWADGFSWADAFQGWEIWNEPDGISNCYVIPGCAETDLRKRAAIHQTRFCKLFATVLKRLKSEFPDQQIGGPALCWANEAYFRELLQACTDAGVAPDFVSWHGYTSDPDGLLDSVAKMRTLLDSLGFVKTRTNINEWHYIRTWNGIHGRDSAPVAIRRAQTGPAGHVNIDSAAFNVYFLSKAQETRLDEAYWYGSAPTGNWGWLNGDGTHNKCWYSMKLFGDFVRAAQTKVETKVDAKQKTVAAIAGLSADGRTASLVVVDYRGQNEKLRVKVKGLDGVKDVSAVVLDHTRDLTVIPVDCRNGELVLSRLDENSAAYLVTFTK